MDVCFLCRTCSLLFIKCLGYFYAKSTAGHWECLWKDFCSCSPSQRITPGARGSRYGRPVASGEEGPASQVDRACLSCSSRVSLMGHGVFCLGVYGWGTWWPVITADTTLRSAVTYVPHKGRIITHCMSTSRFLFILRLKVIWAVPTLGVMNKAVTTLYRNQDQTKTQHQN